MRYPDKRWFNGVKAGLPMGYFVDIWAAESLHILERWIDFEDEAEAASDCLYDWHYDPDERLALSTGDAWWTATGYSYESPHYATGGYYRNYNASDDRGKEQGVVILREGSTYNQSGYLLDSYTGSGNDSIRWDNSPYADIYAVQFKPEVLQGVGSTLTLQMILQAATNTNGNFDLTNNKLSVRIYDDNGSDQPDTADPRSSWTDFTADTLGLDIAQDGYGEPKWCSMAITITGSQLTAGNKYWFMLHTNSTYSGGVYTEGAIGWQTTNYLTATNANQSFMKKSSILAPPPASWTAFYDSPPHVIHFGTSQTYESIFDVSGDALAETEYPQFTAVYKEPAGTSLTWLIYTGTTATGPWTATSQNYINGDIVKETSAYWRIVVTIDSNTTRTSTPVLYKIGLRFPKKVFRYTTHPEITVPRELTKPVPIIRQITAGEQKININDMIGVGRECTVTLNDNEKYNSSNFVYEKHADSGKVYWKNSLIMIKRGPVFEGISPYDHMLDFYVGLVDDYDFTNNDTLTLKCIDGMIDLKEEDILNPRDLYESGTDLLHYNVEGKTTDDKVSLTPIQYDGVHPVDILLDILLNLINRYGLVNKFSQSKSFLIDFASFQTVKDSLTTYDGTFYRSPIQSLSKATLNAAPDNHLWQFAHGGLTEYIGTSVDGYYNGLRLFTEEGNEYVIADHDDTNDDIYVDKTIKLNDSNGDDIYVTTWDTQIKEQANAKDVIKSILELMRCYLFISESGKVTLIEYDSAASSDDTWYDKDILGIPTCRIDTSQHFYNRCEIYYLNDGNGDNFNKNYKRVVVYNDLTSQEQWNKKKSKKIKAPWLQDPDDVYGGQTLAKAIAAAWVGQFADGAVFFKVKTDVIKDTLEQGDIVTLHIKKGWVEPQFRADGIDTVNCIIINKKPQKNTIMWELLKLT